jgi:hypothetical protein
MSFLSNAENFSLGEGVYNNVHGTCIVTVHNHLSSARRQREEIEGRWSCLEYKQLSDPRFSDQMHRMVRNSRATAESVAGGKTTMGSRSVEVTPLENASACPWNVTRSSRQKILN